MAKSKDNSLIWVLIAVIGVVGLIILLRRNQGSVQAIAAPAPAPAMTYDNEERIEFPKGFDPVTLMPLQIVVHRTAVVRK